MELFKHLPEEEDGRLEWLHQIDCVSWVKEHYPDLVFFHCKNETDGSTNKRNLAKRTQAGVLKGVSDNMILTPTRVGGYAFSCVELKRPLKKAKPLPEQISFGERVELNGGLFVICWGMHAFRRFITEYYGQ